MVHHCNPTRLSRAKNDNPNIIASLLELASIKTDIKDYTLAMRDLNEALSISSKNHYPKLESASATALCDAL